MSLTNFSAVDTVVVALYLLVTMGIGLVARRRVRGMADFLVCGRRLRPGLAVATMIGSELGLITLMYSAEKGFNEGFAAFHIALVAGVVTLIVGISGFIVVPLRERGVMTIPEFYEQRFGRGVRIFGGLILAAAGILNMGLFLKAGSQFVVGVTGMEGELQLKLVMTALLLLVLVYTSLGGMLSVVLTDYLQFVVLSVGLLLTCLMAVGTLGYAEILDTVSREMGPSGFDPFDAEGGFGPAYVVWMVFNAGLVSCAIWPTAVMRASSMETTEGVKQLYMWSSVGFLARFMIPYLIGIAAFCAYKAEPAFAMAVLDVDEGQRSLMAMPMYLGRLLPAGLLGLVTAGMLAAFMSTHDSYLLCWASVLTQDVVAPLRRKGLSDHGRIRCTRGFLVAIGMFLLFWGLWYPLEDDLWDYMSITGAIYFTGAFALLVGGLYWHRASRAGAYAALVAGLFAFAGMGGVRKHLSEWVGIPLEMAHVGLFVAALAVVSLVLFSLLFPDRESASGDSRPSGGAR